MHKSSQVPNRMVGDVSALLYGRFGVPKVGAVGIGTWRAVCEAFPLGSFSDDDRLGRAIWLSHCFHITVLYYCFLRFSNISAKHVPITVWKKGITKGEDNFSRTDSLYGYYAGVFECLEEFSCHHKLVQCIAIVRLQAHHLPITLLKPARKAHCIKAK